MVRAGQVRAVGQRRPGVASLFSADQVDGLASGRNLAAGLAVVAWNAQRGALRPGAVFWFRHEARGDYEGAARILDRSAPLVPPVAFVGQVERFADGFAPGVLRYCIALVMQAARPPARRWPPAARHFLEVVGAAILGGPDIAAAPPDRQAALAGVLGAARSGDFPALLEVAKRFAPALVDGDGFKGATAAAFMRWHRAAYGEGRRAALARPSRASIARLIPSPEDPRHQVSRQQVSRWAVALEAALRKSPTKQRLFAAIMGAAPASVPVEADPLEEVAEMFAIEAAKVRGRARNTTQHDDPED